ncbi:hypothetical protein KW429_06800 [Vibrio fluvialis]|nr:hypothetical protein [Vibrio fluvialis]
MWAWMKAMIARYDACCRAMGLTPDQKRCCVPYRKDPAHDQDGDKV